MATRDGERNRIRWQARRDAWFAQHPACFQCGSTENLRIHWNGEGPKPRRSMLEAFRLREPDRSQLLADCVAICYTCWRLTQLRNIHGGGKTGISGCNCGLCLPLRRASSREYGRRQTAIWQQRRAAAVEKGLPVPKRHKGWDNNAWGRTQAAVDHKRTKRQEARDAWMKGKSCVICGGGNDLRTTWIERPGPLRSTSEIWAYGIDKRDEYLEKCHTLCVSCLRTSTNGRKKEKS